MHDEFTGHDAEKRMARAEGEAVELEIAEHAAKSYRAASSFENLVKIYAVLS